MQPGVPRTCPVREHGVRSSTARSLTVAGLVLSVAFLLSPFATTSVLADPTSAVEPLDVSADPTVHLLTPGDTALWPIGVATNVFRLDELQLNITAVDESGSGGAGLSSLLTVQISGCTRSWIDQACPGDRLQVVPPAPLSSTYGSDFGIGGPVVPRRSHLLVQVTMANTPGAQELRGASTRITVTVEAAGLLAPDNGPEPGEPAPPGNPEPGSPGPLPNTGARIAEYLLLGLASVTVGSVISGVARRRRHPVNDFGGRL